MGLECTENGVLKFEEGFDSAAYSLWYKYNDTAISSGSDEISDWKKSRIFHSFQHEENVYYGRKDKVYVD